MKCLNCKYFFLDKRLKGEVNGECRYNTPPFPSIKSTEWCGKFKPIRTGFGGFW